MVEFTTFYAKIIDFSFGLRTYGERQDEGDLNCILFDNGATFSTLLYCSDLNELVTYSTSPGRLHLSDRAHIVFDFHQAIDGLNEAKLGDAKLGETDR